MGRLYNSSLVQQLAPNYDFHNIYFCAFYTIPKGDASPVVELTAQRIIDDCKEFVTLFIDLTNSTSNSIYQKEGFVKIGQNIYFDFNNR
ncbi:MAG: hypothetical protein H7336_12205 [Bacteriovorax sp.]|nr:hypothetical protein [Bacteriovorax sp.]